jgi:hypothetical protein
MLEIIAAKRSGRRSAGSDPNYIVRGGSEGWKIIVTSDYDATET